MLCAWIDKQRLSDSSAFTGGIIGAVLGAVATVSLQQVVSRLRVPNVFVDFQSQGTEKPYLHRLEITNETKMPLTENGTVFANEALFMHLQVSNEGPVPAKKCLARLRLWRGDVEQPIWGWALTWQRLNRLTTVENYVNIYQSDYEILGFLILPLWRRDHPDEMEVGDYILTNSIPSARLDSNTKYRLEVRVAGDNLKLERFNFDLMWDGTFDGFKTCVVMSEKRMD